MSSYDEVGSVPHRPAGRNRARRRTAIGVELMEARILFAGWTSGPVVAPAVSQSVASLTVCLPAPDPQALLASRAAESSIATVPASGKAPLAPSPTGSSFGFTVPERAASGSALLSPTDRDWLTARGLTGRGQIVAVIDSGIAYRHEALGAGFGPAARVVGGFDFAENDADPNDDGPAGYHGTHVAGIVGGQDGGRSGVAPEVAFVALRVFDDQGTTRPEWIEAALEWVSDHRTSFAWPITTVNLSLGALGANAEQSLRSALEDDLRRLREEGVFVAVAAGNRFAAQSAVGVGYPASSEWVTPVAAVDSSGRLAGFSERRAGIFAAPGESIVSTVPDFLTGVDGRNDDYWATSGTSMAAPQVAAASVLARQAWIGAGLGEPSVEQLEEALRAGSEKRVDAATGIEFAVLNTRRAVEWIESLANVDSGSDPTRNPVSVAAIASSASVAVASGATRSASVPRVLGDTEAPFRAPRIRIPQFTSAGPGATTFPTVVVGDGGSAVVETIQLESPVAAADERMRAIDIVFQLLGRP